MIQGLSSWCKIIHVSLLLHQPHCKNFHVKPGSLKEAQTGGVPLEVEAALDLEWKNELGIFLAGFAF